MKKTTLPITLLCLCFLLPCLGHAQIKPSPVVKEGDGPYSQLIIRGAILINGTGAPAIGPVDIVIEKNVIQEIKQVGYPGVKINPDRRPVLQPGGKEIDANGKYVLPGLIDMHGHIGGTSDDQSADYVFKLWLGHGIT